MSPHFFGSKTKCMAVDNVGFFIEHEPSQKKFLKGKKGISTARHYLMFREAFTDVMFAKTKEEALEKLAKKYRKYLKIGGNENPLQKAMWILPEKTEEYPICEFLHVNKDGYFCCGKIEKESPMHSGEFGDCWMEGVDMPDFCPMKPKFAGEEKPENLQEPTCFVES